MEWQNEYQTTISVTDKGKIMLKRYIAILLCVLLLGGLISCGSSEDAVESDTQDTVSGTESTDALGGSDKDADDGKTDNGKTDGGKTEVEKVATKKTLDSSTAGIKILGERHARSNDSIYCDWTCSGIEFTLESIGGTVSFTASSDAPCLFRAYVDGSEWVSADGSLYYTVNGETTVTLKSVPEGEHVIRFIKISGHTTARAELKSVTYYGTLGDTAPADNRLYIEFIGDSISTGCDNLGVPDTVSNAYLTEDGALAYPYMLATALGADYSITALKGRGVVFGNPNLSSAYLLASPLRSGESSTAYDFERKADVAVINLETNDYLQSVSVSQFTDAYKSLIETVRQKNGEECRIICLYNTMRADTEMGAAIVSIVNELGGSNAGIYAQKLDHSGGGHPTAAQNRGYMSVIKPVIEQAIATPIQKVKQYLTDGGAANADGIVINFSEKFDK